MRMFNKALYYPSIQINDDKWLKNSILFWDEIFTIVPNSIPLPYTNKSCRILADNDVLKSIVVMPEDNIIKQTAIDAFAYIQSNEAKDLLVDARKGKRINLANISSEINRKFSLHPDKLSYELQHYLNRNKVNDRFDVSENFAHFYMTLLANKICEAKGFAPLSDNNLSSNLGNKYRLDNNHDFNLNPKSNAVHKQKNTSLAHGMMIDLILKGFKINSNYSIDTILRFKRKHSDELGNFRVNIEKLISTVPSDMPFDALTEQVNSIYVNEFLPAYNNFGRALTAAKIKWVPDNFIKITGISTTASAFPYLVMGLTIPQTLIVSAIATLSSSLVLYNMAKKESIKTNGYSYLHLVNRKF